MKVIKAQKAQDSNSVHIDGSMALKIKERLKWVRPNRIILEDTQFFFPPLHSIGLLVAINTNGNKAETQRGKSNGEQYKEVYRIVGKQEEMQ